MIRTEGLAPDQATRMIRSLIKDVDAGGGALAEVSPLSAQVEGLMQSPRFNTLLLVVFTVSALGLAVLGLYATVAFPPCPCGTIEAQRTERRTGP